MKTLVAGIGNIFRSDDAFGVEVIKRMSAVSWPEGVRVVDFGVRGLHLAYELLGPIDLLVVVDTVSSGEQPGTLSVLDPSTWDETSEDRRAETHGLELDAVFRLLQALGGRVPPTLIVGCEPERVEEGMEMSEAVRAAIDPAIVLVDHIVRQNLGARLAVAQA